MIARRYKINNYVQLISYCVLLLAIPLFAQSLFSNADIQMDNVNHVPSVMRFGSNSHVTQAEFWEAFNAAYGVTKDVEMSLTSTNTDEYGQIHYQYVQMFKGIEIVDYQYLLHERNGSLYLAHGHLITGLNIDVHPKISKEAALEKALAAVDAEHYMWENEENENWIKRIKNDSTATYYPSSDLKLTTGTKSPGAENVHLVYRFKISAEQPFGEYYVDVDAHSGEIVNKTSISIE